MTRNVNWRRQTSVGTCKLARRGFQTSMNSTTAWMNFVESGTTSLTSKNYISATTITQRHLFSSWSTVASWSLPRVSFSEPRRRRSFGNDSTTAQDFPRITISNDCTELSSVNWILTTSPTAPTSHASRILFGRRIGSSCETNLACFSKLLTSTFRWLTTSVRGSQWWTNSSSPKRRPPTRSERIVHLNVAKHRMVNVRRAPFQLLSPHVCSNTSPSRQMWNHRMRTSHWPKQARKEVTTSQMRTWNRPLLPGMMTLLTSRIPKSFVLRAPAKSWTSLTLAIHTSWRTSWTISTLHLSNPRFSKSSRA